MQVRLCLAPEYLNLTLLKKRKSPKKVRVLEEAPPDIPSLLELKRIYYEHIIRRLEQLLEGCLCDLEPCDYYDTLEPGCCNHSFYPFNRCCGPIKIINGFPTEDVKQKSSRFPTVRLSRIYYWR